MNKRFLLFLISGFVLNFTIFSFPFRFILHNKVQFESVDKLYYLSENEFDKIKKYYRDGTYFLCMADEYSELKGNDRKSNVAIGNFTFALISETQYKNYEIKKIQIINGKNQYDINDILYLPYPYEKPLKTEFKKDFVYPNYFVSRYLLGYFKVPAKNNDLITIRVSILFDKDIYEFDYLYKVHTNLGFIILND